MDSRKTESRNIGDRSQGTAASATGRVHLNHTASLTSRERAIIGLVGEGLSYEEIGRRLQVDTSAVKSHVRDILGKLGFRTRLEIAGYARRNGSGSLMAS